MEINYPVLKGGDRVLCGGKSPFATVTRVVTSGWKDWNNYDIAVHTGLVIDFYGQKLIAEMQPKGLEINSLEKYTTEGGKRFILDIVRYSLMNDSMRLKLQERIALYRRMTIEYDYVGLMEFVFERVKDNKGKNYCSEFDYLVTKKVGIKTYPKRFEVKVSPKDLQNLSTWHSVPNWKL